MILVLIILRTVIEIVVAKNNNIHSNTNSANSDTSNTSISNRSNYCHYSFEGVYRCIYIQPSDRRVLFGSTVTLCNMSNSLNSLKGSI